MTTINQLSAVSSLIAGDLIPVFSTANGDARKASMTVVAAYVAANLGDAVGDTLTLDGYVKTTAGLTSDLPSPGVAGPGSRASVTDATQALTAGIGAVVAGGGANTVPVFCDGTNWRIG